jgi:NCAIR mutase (PurE)-related protein
MNEPTATAAQEIVRTEPLTKADRRLIKDYSQSRQKVVNIVREAQLLNDRMNAANEAVPRFAAKLANTLATRLGFVNYNELKAQGLDLSIDSKAGTVAVIKAKKVEPPAPDESTEDVREDLSGEVES